jgi:hypothetical protein
MRLRPLLVTLAATGAVLAGCGGSASGPTSSNNVTSKTASGIVTAAVNATKQQSSFHFEEDAVQPTSTVTLIGDIGKTSAQQAITVTSGKTSGHVTLLLANGVVYFRADVLGLQSFSQFTAAQAAKYANKWISVSSADNGYHSLIGTLTVSNAATQLVKLPGTMTKGGTSVQGGIPVVAVDTAQTSSSGTLSITMYVQTTGPALPVKVTAISKTTPTSSSPTVSGTREVTATFSKWNEPVNVVAPKNAVPIATALPAAG